MAMPPFNKKELRIVEELELPFGVPGKTPVYDFPVSPKDAVKLLYKGTPPWQIMNNLGIEFTPFNPGVLPDNHARAMVLDATTTPETNTLGGKDMFGVTWEYRPETGGSMVRPGNPLIANARELSTKLVWPSIDEWGWEGCSAANKGFIDDNLYVSSLFFTGWFERLVSLMDFEGALIAMVDVDDQVYVKEFFDHLTDLYIDILDRLIVHFPQIDAFCIHDDWGSQQNSFFSPELAAEMIVPYMKRVVNFLHSKGLIADFHSCGNIINMVPNMIAVGWDSWSPQELNDTAAIYDEFGDKILIGVMPDIFDPDETTEEEQRNRARVYAERFCRKDKPSALNMYAVASAQTKAMITPVFREELYKQSRQFYT